jgi:hypothetical protein
MKKYILTVVALLTVTSTAMADYACRATCHVNKEYFNQDGAPQSKPIKVEVLAVAKTKEEATTKLVNRCLYLECQTEDENQSCRFTNHMLSLSQTNPANLCEQTVAE